MKKIILFFGLLVFLSSCLRDECTSTREYYVYSPVMLHTDEFRKDIIQTYDVVDLENPGKLYFYQNYLLINEQGRGIHFYDISNRKNPEYVAFYDIPGNFDMAIYNNVLYADNVVDMISIDISDVANPELIHREENYNQQYEPENQMYHAYSIATNRVEIVDCSDVNFGNNTFWRDGFFFAEANFDVIDNLGSRKSYAQGGGSGIGGSFARFTISKNHLYTVSNSALKSWELDNGQVSKVGERQLGWGIETIFPFQDYLFIGSNAGMFIFDNSNPAAPVQTAVFEHAQACDPVVTDGEYAYVTLRDGNECQGFVNQLDVVDIANIRSPRLVKSYGMKNPHGLSVNGDKLFICEGDYGFKIMDVSNPGDVEEVKFIKDIKTYDVIALNNDDLFIVGEDGFYLTSYKDEKLVLHSAIKAIKN